MAKDLKTIVDNLLAAANDLQEYEKAQGLLPGNQIWEKMPYAEFVKENRIAFMEKLHNICKRLGIKDEWLLQVMYSESGINHKAVNPHGGATGLIQFMPATAKWLGTTTDALLKMSNVEQLDWVEKYYESYKGKYHSLADLYLATFYPAAMDKPDSYTFPQKVYEYNKAIDVNKDGVLTKYDFRQFVRHRIPKKYEHLFE